ncbi:hypothetical protein [Solilutibacter silvestris]|uniref:hypothetical protein n=1 Tax=Solilutibacter silvestris TaxID=1645665 RepID=UPI00101AD511|nr:hypothetical protein [Lysobacter silvestris]
MPPARSLLAASILLMAIQGCSSAMTSPTDRTPSDTSTSPAHGQLWEWPLKFVRHNFTMGAFDVQSYRVVYANFPYTSDGPEPSLASFGHRHADLFTAWRLSLPNFPPPADLNWVSKDGTMLHATVDLDQIFKDRLIRHNVPRDEVSPNASIGDPGIIIEIDNRTVNVYMLAHIATKHLQIPGNKYSDFRNDLIKVYSKTY